MPAWSKTTRIRVVGGRVEFRYARWDKTDLSRALSHYGEALDDWSPVFEAFWPYQLGSIQRNFAMQGRPNHWRRLAPSTIRDRVRKGYGKGPILQRSRKLLRSFKADWDKKSFRITNTARARNGFRYFQAHQFGTRHIPQRIMVVLLKQDQAQFTKIARRHIQYRKR